MSVSIRPADVEDAPALAEYAAALFAERLDGIRMRQAPTEQEEVAFITRIRATPGALLLVAVDGPRIVGMLDFMPQAGEMRRHAGAFGMSVARDHRGQGIGRQLIERLVSAKRAEGQIRRIELEVAPRNATAIALYERCGFVHEGRKRLAVNLTGQPEDALLMSFVW
jgi:ribosomal protein S18 acetylase RimI-like enzyme